jgi:Holliday junction resolvase RusA-like endonuclease
MKVIVPGPPETQGSKSCVCIKGKGRLLEGKTSAGRKRFEAWRKNIADRARLAVMGDPGAWPATGAVQVRLDFYLDRPARPRDPWWPSARGSGDVDKYARAALDAITGVLVVDDSQVCELTVSKVYGDQPGLVIAIEALVDNPAARPPTSSPSR